MDVSFSMIAIVKSMLLLMLMNNDGDNDNKGVELNCFYMKSEWIDNNL